MWTKRCTRNWRCCTKRVTNGRPSITLDVLKAQDANVVDTGRGVVAAVEELRGEPREVLRMKTFNGRLPGLYERRS